MIIIQPSGWRRGLVLLAVVLVLSGAVLSVVMPQAQAASFGLDKSVSVHQATGSTSVTSPAFSTAQSNELLAAFIACDGPSGTTQTITSVTGGGLNWTLRKQTNAQAGVADIWTAVAPTTQSNITVKATHSGSYSCAMTVASFVGANLTAGAGAVGSGSAATGAPSASLTTTVAGSWVWGVGEDWDRATTRTVGPNQTKVDEYLSPSGDTYWTQRQTTVTPASGTSVTINDTAPTADRWDLALIEIQPASADTPPPDTTAPTAQLVAPIDGAALSGVVAINATAADDTAVAGVQFLLDGNNLGAEVTSAPYNFSWNTATVSNGIHALSARARDAAGNMATATNVTVTVTNQPSGLAPTIDPSTPAATPVKNNVLTTISPTFSPPSGSVLYAAVSMDSASYNGQTTTVSSVSNSGVPLAWHLLGRENGHSTTAGGFVEIWWAYNPTAQASITTTVAFSQNTKNVTPPVGDFQVLVMDNAAADQTAAAWSANALLTSKNNSPFVNLTTTRSNSQVFAIFDNWDNSEIPIPGTNQSIQSIVLNSADRDGYWLQQQNTPTATAGTNVLMNATDPGIANEWHALAWEVLSQ